MLALFAMSPTFAQRPPSISMQSPRMGRSPRPLSTDDPMSGQGQGPSLSRRMLKASYEQMQKDAERLSELAEDLKAEVSSSDNEDTLSISTIKKAEEIEKLAKKIQSRMKNL
jgi:hypothetical protein